MDMNLVTTNDPATIEAKTLTLRVISDADQLEAVRQAWLDLLGRSAMNELMLTPMWLYTWWDVYGKDSGRELRVGLFYDNERLVGIAPFFMRRLWRRPGLLFRRLEPLGADVDEQDGVCSDYLNVIAERGSEERIATRFARHVAAGDFGAWDELVLPTMDGEGVMPPLLVRAFEDIGKATSLERTGVAHYVPLASTWDAYLNALHKRYRYLVRKTWRDFERWGGDDVEYRHIDSVDEFAEGKRILHELHRERWQAKGEGGVFASQRFQTFHDRIMPELFNDDSLAFFWVVVRGEPIAVDYSFRWSGKHYVYQGGRKMDLPKEQRPGIVVATYGIQRAIERGMREFDFLAGDAVYKRQLALASRPIVTFRAVRPSWKECVRRFGEGGISCVRGVRDGMRKTTAWFRKKRGSTKNGAG